MAETFCVCCGAEVNRDWRLSVSVEELICIKCSKELEEVGTSSRLDELETLEYLQRWA